MLKHLLIENYALIEKLDIDIEEGLTVITGETGAGKSILLGALSLILGQRADTRVLMNKERKCIIEGTFDISQIPINHLFEKHLLDYDLQCLLRREITPQGKSRAFINDTPVNLNVLTEIAAQLIDIHSQHQNLLIGETSFQFDVLDSFAGHFSLVASYRNFYQQMIQIKNELLQMQEQEKQSRSDLDYLRFQLDELDNARLNAEEFAQMEEQLQVLQHAEEIRTNLGKGAYLMDQAEENFIGGLNQVLQLIRPLARYSEKYLDLQQRLESVLIESRDVAREMDILISEVVYDPEKAGQLQQRLDLINRLLLKHNAPDIQTLEKIREDYRGKIEDIDSLEEQIRDLEKQLHQKREELMKQALIISEGRMKAIPGFERQITSLLHKLGMPAARFRVQCQQKEVPAANGTDAVSFLFNANVGGGLQEISRVASGGELSRLMLAIKSVISRKNLLPTIIFDEIDTGISGETGSRVGMLLQTIARNMQVITITHLPQIASRGNTHLLVYKMVENGQTRTSIKKTQPQERVEEIAKMLGGEKPSETMINTAKELIFNGMNHS